MTTAAESDRSDVPEASELDPSRQVAAIADTPSPPYVAVIFTSLRSEGDHGYAETAAEMERLAAQQPGYLGIEAARDGLGITVSYWRDEQAARSWKQVSEHLRAQRRGREAWYTDYVVRVATVTREYGMRAE